MYPEYSKIQLQVFSDVLEIQALFHMIKISSIDKEIGHSSPCS
jgi:hypothetical protein